VHWLPADSPKPFVTNEEYLRDIPHQLGNGITTHHGVMPEITLHSDTEAEGIWAMFDYVQVSFDDRRVSIQGYGHYFETYRKCDDGRWRISSKRNERLRIDTVDWTLPDS
jgi:hypothetical protein